MKKTLIELLQDKKYQKTNIKVGSKSGSGFWYCGKGDKAFSIPDIKKIRERLLKQSKGLLKQLQNRLLNLDSIYDKTLERAKNKVKDYDKYAQRINIKRERERVMLPKKIVSVEYDIATNLFDRPVQEIVEGISPDEKPCWIIYIKGNEKGAYWTIAEYTKRRKNKALEDMLAWAKLEDI